MKIMVILVKDLKSRKSHYTIFGTDLQLALPMRVLNSRALINLVLIGLHLLCDGHNINATSETVPSVLP